MFFWDRVWGKCKEKVGRHDVSFQGERSRANLITLKRISFYGNWKKYNLKCFNKKPQIKHFYLQSLQSSIPQLFLQHTTGQRHTSLRFFHTWKAKKQKKSWGYPLGCSLQWSERVETNRFTCLVGERSSVPPTFLTQPLQLSRLEKTNKNEGNTIQRILVKSDRCIEQLHFNYLKITCQCTHG